MRETPDLVSPGGEAELTAATYELQAKVAGRAKVTAAVEVDGPLSLRCQPQDKGEVHCTPVEGGTPLVLRP